METSKITTAVLGVVLSALFMVGCEGQGWMHTACLKGLDTVSDEQCESIGVPKLRPPYTGQNPPVIPSEDQTPHPKPQPVCPKDGSATDGDVSNTDGSTDGSGSGGTPPNKRCFVRFCYCPPNWRNPHKACICWDEMGYGEECDDYTSKLWDYYAEQYSPGNSGEHRQDG